jgi:hypothetical protein
MLLIRKAGIAQQFQQSQNVIEPRVYKQPEHYATLG